MNRFMVPVFSYLLNADLDCITAYEAIVNVLGFESMKRLQRYQWL